MPGPAAVGACSSSFRRVPAPSTGSKGRRVRAGQGTYRGSRRCAQHSRSHSWREAPNLVVFRPWDFLGTLFADVPVEPRLSGPRRCGSRHRRPWLHTCHPSRRVTQITDAGNRFERHGNRAGVAARGRNPPVWCERMNGVLLTALSGSQPLWIRGRRPFRRGNPLSEMARTMSDLHIFAILL